MTTLRFGVRSGGSNNSADNNDSNSENNDMTSSVVVVDEAYDMEQPPLSSYSSSPTSWKQPQEKGEPVVFRILTSTRYVTALKMGQYISCVCLALTLFSEEFFGDDSKENAEEIIFYVFVTLPALFFHLPLWIRFVRSLPTKRCGGDVRMVVWNHFQKQLVLECVLLGLFLSMIPFALHLTIANESEVYDDSNNRNLFHWVVSIPGTILSVNYYYFAVSSFYPYKADILGLRQATGGKGSDDKSESRNRDDYEWECAIQKHAVNQQQKSTQGACRVFLRLMIRFPVSSFVAWISLILYTSCLPLQGLTVGYITQAVAEATPQSSFWELFEPGLYFLLTSAGMAIFLWTMKMGFASFNAAVEDYFRLQMTRSVCSGGQCSKKTTTSAAALLDSGDLSSRYSRDLALIANFIDKNKLFTSSGILASSFVVLFTVDWRMGFFFLVSCPALISMLAGKPGEAHKAGTLAAARLQSLFENCVELRRTMDLYNAGDYVYTKSVESMKDDMRVIGHSKWIGAHFVSAVHATGLAYTSLISFAFILYSIPLARENPSGAVNHLSVAVVILSQLKSPFSQIGQGVEHWLSIAPALLRLDQFSYHKHYNMVSNKSNSSTGRGKNEIPTSTSSGGGGAVPEESSSSLAIGNSLELRNIRFRYNSTGPDVLQGVNVKLERGKYSCIVGGSGAGKSTLLNILTRELSETDGSLLLDGQLLLVQDDTDVQTTAQYREQLAIVFQSATFLDGTIADNIRLGKTTATDEEVAMAAQRAQCTFLRDLPLGLDTKLGNGVDLNLSGGQAQRICLARALCRNPRLLILDEATSALDPHTEQEAVKTFVDLAHEENVAVVSVTHRLDTTDTSDNVIVLKDGVVAEEGNPADLYGRKGLYYNMRTR